MRPRPRILTLIIMTLIPCALFALRWYSFHAFDYLLGIRGTSAFSILLCNGTVQFETTKDSIRTVKLLPDEHELVGGTLVAGHSYDSDSRVAALKGILSVLIDEDTLRLEPPTHNWHAFGFGSSSYDHDHPSLFDSQIPPRRLPMPPPTVVHYLQFPLWLLIVIFVLFALRKWWQFWKAIRIQQAFPVELTVPPSPPIDDAGGG